MFKRKRRQINESGATLVEAAIVFPAVVMFTLAIFEFGLYWRNDLTISQVARDASRAAAAAGAQCTPSTTPCANSALPEGDIRALRIIRTLAGSGGVGSIKSVLIYKPEITNVNTNERKYTIPAGCVSGTGKNITTAGVAGKCNSYPASVLNFSGSDINTLSMATYSTSWPVTSRCDRYSTVLNSEPDLIGVYVNSYYESVTKFPPLNLLSGAQTAQVVTRIEPKNDTQSACIG